MTLTKVLRDTGLSVRVTVHGLKWAKQRLHIPSSVSRVPISTLFTRRCLIDAWAAFLTGETNAPGLVK